jgi:ElaA protein
VHSRERPVPEGPLLYSASPFDALGGRDVHDLLALRAEIFVVEQHCVYLDPDGHDLEAWHLLGRDAGGVLGAYARVFLVTAETPHRIGRVVVHRALRGGGEGRRLMAQALDVCASHGGGPVELSAQAHLERFYGSLGFAPISERYVLDGIDHVDMRRP